MPARHPLRHMITERFEITISDRLSPGGVSLMLRMMNEERFIHFFYTRNLTSARGMTKMFLKFLGVFGQNVS